MTSFADIILLAGLVAAARGAAPDTLAVTPALAGRIAATIASTWSVPAGDVRLEWGRLSGGVSRGDDAPFRVVGSGADGWFAVVIEPANGPAVAARVRAGVEDSLTVAARSLAAGARLAPEDMRQEIRVVWGPPREGAEPPEVGWEVRRSMAAGDVLARPSVAPAAVVLAGKPVQLEWRQGAVVVCVTGTALNSAAVGETVRVRAAGRSSAVVGVVSAAGKAVIGTGGTG